MFQGPSPQNNKPSPVWAHACVRRSIGGFACMSTSSSGTKHQIHPAPPSSTFLDNSATQGTMRRMCCSSYDYDPDYRTSTSSVDDPDGRVNTSDEEDSGNDATNIFNTSNHTEALSARKSSSGTKHQIHPSPPTSTTQTTVAPPTVTTQTTAAPPSLMMTRTTVSTRATRRTIARWLLWSSD